MGIGWAVSGDGEEGRRGTKPKISSHPHHSTSKTGQAVELESLTAQSTYDLSQLTLFRSSWEIFISKNLPDLPGLF